MHETSNKDLQYELEQRWRQILLDEPTEENYANAYAELHRFKLAHGDPRTNREEAGGLYRGTVSFAGKCIARLIGSGSDVLEFGCGDGALAFLLAVNGNRVTATDVSDVALAACNKELANRKCLSVQFKHGEATSVDCPDSTFDFVVSQDLIEHLHEELMTAHLNEVKRVLKPGGSYIFWTPTRLYGETSMGMHLKEYDLRGAIGAVARSGLKPIWVDARWFKLGLPARMPLLLNPCAFAYEGVLSVLGIGKLPRSARQMLAPPILIQAVKCG